MKGENKMTKKKFNYDFKMRDIRSTRAKHKNTIKRMNKTDIKYNQIIDHYFEQELETQIRNDTMYHYGWVASEVKDYGITQKIIRSIKAHVNSVTKQMIVNSLEYEGYPKSWATAFYLDHKTMIDAMMRRVAKNVVRDLKKRFKR